MSIQKMTGSISGMVKIAKTIFLLLVFFVASAVFAQVNNFFPAESIPLYEVTITPKSDGTFSVVETIYYDFARNYKHGITRTIPIKHPQESSIFYKNRISDITFTSATKDGVDVQYEIIDRGDNLFVKIGNPNITMTSEHKFTISYNVAGGFQYFDTEPAELYWDAIGADSEVDILKAVVTVDDTQEILTGVSACYVGLEGEGNGCGAMIQDGSKYQYSVEDIGKYRGVTIAFGLKDSVETLIVEKTNLWYFIVPGSILLLLGFVVVAYRYRTAFKTGRPIIAQYEPYEDLKPMYTGVLMDDTLHPQDITACIIYLAQQGYIKIKKIDKKVLFFFEVDDYEVTLINDSDKNLSQFQTNIVSLLFSQVQAGESVTLSKLKFSMSKQQENQKILKKLREDIKKDLVTAGYFQSKSLTDLWPVIMLGLGLVGIAFVVFIPAGVLLVLFGVLGVSSLRRRTRKGYEALDYLKGFKDFLSVTEKERYKFHNSPEKSPEQFMEFLPYAIAFDVEEKWAEAFKDVTLPDPDWYEGGNAGSFSSTNLATSLGAFSTAFASTTGSSSSGGSGGGGSVGGGGGGGSVGSW